ncbi:hypothetical protein AHF37_06769 [Paragonimus kellicotti]|nr:hypothetical protein AHF37_06769 [Paragonimus kellicotti]
MPRVQMGDLFHDIHRPSNVNIAHIPTWQDAAYKPDPSAPFQDGSASNDKGLLCPSEDCFFDTRTHPYPVPTFSINLPVNNWYKQDYVGIVQHTPSSFDTVPGIDDTNQQALDECSQYATAAYPCSCNPGMVSIRPTLIPPVVMPTRIARPQVQLNSMTVAAPRSNETGNMTEKDTSLRRFACDYPDCEKSYGKRSHLTAHYRKHTAPLLMTWLNWLTVMKRRRTLAMNMARLVDPTHPTDNS